MSDLSSVLTQLTEQISKSSISSTGLLDSSVSSLKDSLGSTKKLFDASNIVENSILGSTTTEVDAAKKAASQNFSDLAKNLAGQSDIGAVVPSTSFITSTSRQIIDDASLTTLTSGLNLSNLSSATQAKLQDFTGLTDISDTNKLTESFTSKLGSNQISSVANSSVLKSIMKSKDLGLSMSSIPGTTSSSSGFSLSGILSKAKSYLPTNLLSNVGALSGLTNNQLLGKVNVLNKLGDLSQYTSNISSVLGLGGSYPELTDANGNTLYGYGNDSLDYNTSDNLYRNAQRLCNNLSLPDLLQYANLKDLFDIILSAVLGNGMAQLLMQLLNCTKYIDSRSTYIMKQGSRQLERAGDIYSLNTVKGYVGRSGFSNPLKSSRIVSANMRYNTRSNTELTSFLDTFGMSKEDLVKDEYGPSESISAQQVGFLSYKSTDLVDSFMDTDTRNTALSFLSGW